jgi:hypothetical protein
MQNEEINISQCSFYVSGVIKVRRVRWAGHTARMREINAYRVFLGNLEGKKYLGSPSCRWKGNN